MYGIEKYFPEGLRSDDLRDKTASKMETARKAGAKVLSTSKEFLKGAKASAVTAPLKSRRMSIKGLDNVFEPLDPYKIARGGSPAYRAGVFTGVGLYPAALMGTAGGVLGGTAGLAKGVYDYAVADPYAREEYGLTGYLGGGIRSGALRGMLTGGLAGAALTPTLAQGLRLQRIWDSSNRFRHMELGPLFPRLGKRLSIAGAAGIGAGGLSGFTADSVPDIKAAYRRYIPYMDKAAAISNYKVAPILYNKHLRPLIRQASKSPYDLQQTFNEGLYELFRNRPNLAKSFIQGRGSEPSLRKIILDIHSKAATPYTLGKAPGLELDKMRDMMALGGRFLEGANLV